MKTMKKMSNLFMKLMSISVYNAIEALVSFTTSL